MEPQIQAQEGRSRGGGHFISSVPTTLEPWPGAGGAVAYPGATCGLSRADKERGCTE